MSEDETHEQGIDIASWCAEVLENMQAWEEREIVVHHIPERNAVAHWIIRCLANPACEGSREVLESIERRRQRVQA